MPTKKCKLADIAQRVGVNRSEVSRVLSGIRREGRIVSPATRQHILEVARELKYYPDKTAQSLTKGCTNTVGLMMTMPVDRPFTGSLPDHYHETIGSLAYTLHEYGMHLLLAQCAPKHSGERAVDNMVQMMRSQSCDGMVLSDITVDDGRPAALEEIGVPFAVIGSSDWTGVHAVDVDNVQVGYEAVSYLYGLGHRHVAVYNSCRSLTSGQNRLRGITQACAELGIEQLEYRDDVHIQADVYAAVAQRLDDPAFPTAIFTEDEASAFGAEQALNEAGLRVPEDVSIITCMNSRVMRLMTPRLTVINLRQKEVASAAAHLIASQLRGTQVEKLPKLLPPALEPAGTTGPPRKHRLKQSVGRHVTKS